MSINDYTKKREKGKHLTLIERGQIEVYLKLGKTKKYIAEQIVQHSQVNGHTL